MHSKLMSKAFKSLSLIKLVQLMKPIFFFVMTSWRCVFVEIVLFTVKPIYSFVFIKKGHPWLRNVNNEWHRCGLMDRRNFTCILFVYLLKFAFELKIISSIAKLYKIYKRYSLRLMILEIEMVSELACRSTN